jgi:hypothetical protein
MMKESLYEQIVVVVDRPELAQLLGVDGEFELERIDDKQEKIHIPSDLVVDSWASSVESRLTLDFLYVPDA